MNRRDFLKLFGALPLVGLAAKFPKIETEFDFEEHNDTLVRTWWETRQQKPTNHLPVYVPHPCENIKRK